MSEINIPQLDRQSSFLARATSWIKSFFTNKNKSPGNTNLINKYLENKNAGKKVGGDKDRKTKSIKKSSLSKLITKNIQKGNQMRRIMKSVKN
jgi:hypothetical protein